MGMGGREWVLGYGRERGEALWGSPSGGRLPSVLPVGELAPDCTLLPSSSSWRRKTRHREERGERRELGAKGTSPLLGLRSHKTVAGTFGALAGAALGDLPVSRARVSGLLPPCPTVCLPREKGGPVRRVSGAVSAPRGKWGSPDPTPAL